MLGPRKIIPHDQIPEIPGFHKRSMLMMVAIAIVGVSPAVIGNWVLGIEATWWMGVPFFCVPLSFFILMFRRSRHAKCPDCQRPMQRQETVLVIEPRMRMGKYDCPPWTVFHCPHCGTGWRVHAIKMGEGAHRITEEERQRIIDSKDAGADG